jgi:signal transduction histidine kinase
MKKLLNSFKKYFVIWIAVICWGIVSITNFGPRLSTFLALFPFILFSVWIGLGKSFFWKVIAFGFALVILATYVAIYFNSGLTDQTGS